MTKRELLERIKDLEEALENHRLSGHVQQFTWTPAVRVGSSSVRCTCPPNRGDNYAGSCPIHDAQTSYS